MKMIKVIMNVPVDLYAMWMARGLSLGTPLNEVLNKIKTEIEDYCERSNITFDSSISACLDIIDKYREETE